MKYTTDHFIKKVEDTPEEMFCMGTYTDGKKKCILAMCGHNRGSISPDESNALFQVFDKIKAYPTQINDGLDKRYKQSTPKQRLLAAFYDIKDIEQQEANVLFAIKNLIIKRWKPNYQNQ